jgi:hypothetical protein
LLNHIQSESEAYQQSESKRSELGTTGKRGCAQGLRYFR